MKASHFSKVSFIFFAPLVNLKKVNFDFSEPEARKFKAYTTYASLAACSYRVVTGAYSQWQVLRTEFHNLLVTTF